MPGDRAALARVDFAPHERHFTSRSVARPPEPMSFTWRIGFGQVATPTSNRLTRVGLIEQPIQPVRSVLILLWHPVGIAVERR